MKILIVSPKLNHGGAERVAVCLANGFVSAGHEVTVFSNLYEEITYALDPHVSVHNLVGKSASPVFRWLSAIRILRKHLRKERPDVIIGIMQLCSFVAKMAATGMQIPVVMTEHDSFERPTSAPFTSTEKFCKFYLNRIYDHVTVLTTADKIIADKYLKHVSVMPNPLAIQPVDVSAISELRSGKEKTILASGRLYDWHYKGLDVLIKAYAKAASILKSQVNSVDFCHDSAKCASTMALTVPKVSSDGWMLEIAGYGDDEDVEFLKGIARECGVENRVRFLGFCNDVVSLYRRSEIFVLSSRYEGFGLVLIEAMSQGCACVGCDYKGRQREIIQDDSQGMCCEPDNVEALANAMMRMMEDEEYRKEVQEKAVKRSEYYLISDTIKRWDSLLKQLVH